MRQTRKTKQESAISSEVSKMDGFFTAEDLFSRIRSSHPKIGLATVYRRMKKMAADGNLHRFRHGRSVVYSSRPNNVTHFICERCGRTAHLRLDSADFIGLAKKDIGGRVCHFQLDIFGVCKICLEKRK